MRNFEATISIEDPITYFIIGKRKYYLTAQVFYSSTHFMIRKQIVDRAKLYLHKHLCRTQFPNLANVAITLCLYHTRKNWDLDNKDYFWKKILIDYLKGRAITEDNVSIVNELHAYFREGEPKMEIIIRGQIKS